MFQIKCYTQIVKFTDTSCQYIYLCEFVEQYFYISMCFFPLQICRNINRIKVCMETGQTVVLLNLENLYESLYDALNQVRLCDALIQVSV